MPWMHLTCGSCGHTADLDEFCRTPIAGDLPKGHFQCPSCRTAWQRKQSDYRIVMVGKSPLIIPGKVELVPVDARL